MIRCVLFCCVLVAAILPANAQETKPLASLDLDLNRLKTWGTKVYTYEASRPGSDEKTITGRVAFKTEVADDAVLLSDRMEISFKGEKLSLDLTHRCKKDSFLSPVRIDSKGEGDDEFGTFVVTINDEGATVQSDSRERKMELPKNVVTWSAFFRLVTLLPRQEGSRISYPYSLESGELNLKKDFLVECMGRDIVKSGKEGVTCTKFRLTGGGNHPAYYWVDDDDVLRQVLIDERKWIRLRDDPDEAEKRANAEKRSKQANKTAETLRRSIREEIKTLGSHEWAGEYYYGDGLGINVSLIVAPKSGYLFEWHGCLGLYDRNYGAITSDKGRLRLSFTFPNKRKGFQGIAEELIPIAWGDRMYLVPSDGIVGFCNEVNDGSEPRKGVHGFFLLREGDEKKKVKEFPDVPGEFRPYLLARPIEAEIIGVGKYTTRPSVCDWKFKDTPVTLNCGKNKGLLRGMKLHVIKPEDAVESVEVRKVGAEESEAVMTQIGEEEKAGPQIGWKLSTRCRWYSK